MLSRKSSSGMPWRCAALVLVLATTIPILCQAAQPAPPETLAAAVFRRLSQTPAYLDLQAFHERRSKEAGDAWVHSAYGRKMLATLKRLRAEAASMTTIDPDTPDGERIVNFTQDGRIRKFTSIIPSLVESDDAARNDVAGMLARYILEGAYDDGLLLPKPLLPAAQEAFNKGIDAARRADYSQAIRYFEVARQYRDNAAARAPEICFNLGLAESKLPGHELRAIAWFGAYLMADPYAPAPKEAAVLNQMRVLFAKERDNLAGWLNSVQDGAGKFHTDYKWTQLFQVVILWASAGDIAGAQRAAALIPASQDESSFAYHEILKAQLEAGDIAGAQKTTDLIQDRYTLAAKQTTVAKPSGYAGVKTETAYTLTRAQTEVAKARILAGDVAGGEKSLAAAQMSATLIRYEPYVSQVQPEIAEAYGLIQDTSKRDSALFAKAEAEVKRGDLAGAQMTVALIREEEEKSRVRQAITEAQLTRGNTLFDWLRLLEESDRKHPSPLKHEIFTDFSGYLKVLETADYNNDPAGKFAVLRAISETKIEASNFVGHMLRQQQGGEIVR